MQIVDIALKDLLQTLRDRLSTVFLIFMPVIFTVFFGILFNPGAEQTDNRLPLAVINQDAQGVLAASLVSTIDAGDAVRLVDTLPGDREKSLASVASGELAGLLEIPDGYSEQLFGGELIGVSLTVDDATEVGIAARTAVQSAAARVLGSGESARLAAESYARLVPFQSDADRQAFLLESYDAAVVAWNNPPVTVTSQVLQSDSAVEPMTISGYAQSAPGMMVQFAIFGLMIPGGIFVAERNTRTLQRLMTTPLSRTQVLLGHGLGFIAIVFLQQLILVGIAQVFLKVDYLRQPLGTLLMMVSLALMAASLGMLIGMVSKKEEQVILYSLIAMFILAVMGGAWFPLETTGKTFSTIGHLLPSAWAMDGFQNIVLRGLGFQSILLPVGILCGYSLVFTIISIWQFSKNN